MLKANSTMLFQGDSVTDSGRFKAELAPLGDGYPMYFKKLLDKNCPELNISVINKGISGNRTIDLVNRWQEDCIDLQPDYMSILIGVNDTWRRYDRNDPTSDAEYEERYRKIIELTLKLTNAKILLITPYILHVNDEVIKMREDLVGKQAVVRKLAGEYNLMLFELDKVFEDACTTAAPSSFSNDGIHPNDNGHSFIADKLFDIWMK